MTDKQTQTGSQASQELSRSLCQEQIIIYGVDVSKCEGIDLSLHPLAKCKFLKFKTSDGGIAGIWCFDHTKCNFKQLTRKTQECEELKKQLEFTRTHRTVVDAEKNRYSKALEEIEDICNVVDRYELEELQETIFNIIKKVKGEECN